MSSSSKVLGVISCLFFTFLVGLSGCQSITGKTAGETVSDASISTAVQAKLTSDQVWNFPRIDVDTDRGVVNLSGVVETETQRAQAAYLAKQVRGVIMVNNNLQIQNRPPAGKSSSAEIRETVSDKDPLSGGGNIDPSSKMDAQTRQSK